MNIRKLSLKPIIGENWKYEPDFCYADVSGSAELGYFDRMVLFRRNDSTEVSALCLQAIVNNDKKFFTEANKIMAEIGIDIRMGDKLSKIVKRFGTPAFTDYIEKDYYEYYSSYYRGNYYDYNEEFYVVRYHYLLSPDLLVCFGVPKIDNYLTDIEIVNDFEMVSGIMDARIAMKELCASMYQHKEYQYFVDQKIQDKTITGLRLKNTRFTRTKIRNCNIGEIESDDARFRECAFYNVTFNGHFETGDALVERCKFVDCIFHDIYGSVFWELKYCHFQHCLFEKISIKMEDEGLYLMNNEFSDCIFKEIKCEGEGEVSFNKMEGGKIEHIFYKGERIADNQFSNMQIEDVKVELEESASDNEFHL